MALAPKRSKFQQTLRGQGHYESYHVSPAVVAIPGADHIRLTGMRFLTPWSSKKPSLRSLRRIKWNGSSMDESACRASSESPAVTTHRDRGEGISAQSSLQASHQSHTGDASTATSSSVLFTETRHVGCQVWLSPLSSHMPNSHLALQ
jgi:hypothetical protein